MLGVARGPFSDIHGMPTDKQRPKQPLDRLERKDCIERIDHTFHRHSMVWRKNRL